MAQDDVSFHLCRLNSSTCHGFRYHVSLRWLSHRLCSSKKAQLASSIGKHIAQASLIEQELVAAEAAWKNGNNGKARVCARRAVALATEAGLVRRAIPPWRGDAMAHLRQIQQESSFPLPIRQAAERLSTPITQRDAAPFTTDPMIRSATPES
ncbi:MAG: hypothetical protein OEV99_09555 [Nitrospira sp.]|nr:hypothetical protein [Nitrospira sp.]MDH4370082.1 hypothetical protein [Nitrospira sp.]MDH5347407.1 hypothetical protein [Nitrospira sp.]MDH5495983.1 hypothetical protein [Nitrospira sp.]MDH5726485.1 hypothetical protein [Nitrospira sp.]